MEKSAFAQDETHTAVSVQRIDGKVERCAPRILYLAHPLQYKVCLDAKLMIKLSDFGSGELLWCFGCLMFEFLTGRTLLAVSVYSNEQKDRDDPDDDHLIQFNDVSRPLLDSMIAAWPRASKWYDDKCHSLQPYSDEEPYIHESLQDLFAREKLPEIDEDEQSILVALICSILNYDPKQRPPAEELLPHR
ncbi:hypothetical protein BKA63DRAFT_536906 [Paraphoma chrysanthemicola]|nr:hypothetical protein BKA63DRAFT_536906 [Paraphoma chrysanthemicola]